MATEVEFGDCRIKFCAGYFVISWWAMLYYTVSQKKNDNDVLRYNFNAHQPIMIIFGRDIAEWIYY